MLFECLVCVYALYLVWHKAGLKWCHGSLHCVTPVRIRHGWTVRPLPFSTQCCLRDMSHYSVSVRTMTLARPLDLLIQTDSIYSDCV